MSGGISWVEFGGGAISGLTPFFFLLRRVEVVDAELDSGVFDVKGPSGC